MGCSAPGVGEAAGGIEPRWNAEDMLALQWRVRRAPVADYVVRYAMTLARGARVGDGQKEAPGFIREWVRWGIGPRGCQFMIQAAKARAVLRGRPYVSVEDINAVAGPVMRHRLLTTFAATSEGITPDTIVERLIEATVPEEGTITGNERIRNILGPEDPEPGAGA